MSNEDMTDATTTLVNKGSPDSNADGESRSLLQIVQDDLCLALLMTGQAVWAYKENNHIAPGFISLEVLSEICSTLNSLWTSISLRRHLVPQFEAIFTGFYQRAIVLLRKCPNSSVAFHSNLYFDAVVEIILESLVDILTLHDHRHTVAEGKVEVSKLFLPFMTVISSGLMWQLDLWLSFVDVRGQKWMKRGSILRALMMEFRLLPRHQHLLRPPLLRQVQV